MTATGFQTSIPSRHTLTVSQLTNLLRNSIEREFCDVWLEGEISNLRAPSSGHLYCTLKDETSQIRAVLFRSSAIRLRFALREGMQVIVRGRLTVYEPRGEYQIVLELVEPKGIGALQLAFEQLRQRLAADGLFDPGRKKSLPLFPATVGVITSLSGAAIRDILAVFRRRWPILHIIIVPVQVQGEWAGQHIARAVNMLNEQNLVDVIIVGRGGGSLEDLWSFNEEVVVRAVAASRIPIVAAVGHEIDMTLTDLAADLRAPTPSVAAEMVVPVLSEVIDRLRDLTVRNGKAMFRQCLSEHRRLGSSRRGLTHIRFRIQEEAGRSSDSTDRLREAACSRLSVEGDRVREGFRELTMRSPFILIKQRLAVMPQFIKRLEHHMCSLTLQRRRQIEAAMARLHSLSPLAILGRGYSIISRVSDKRIVKRTLDTAVGEDVIAQFVDGQLECAVRRVVPDSTV